jgi:hypothetical protein
LTYEGQVAAHTVRMVSAGPVAGISIAMLTAAACSHSSPAPIAAASAQVSRLPFVSAAASAPPRPSSAPTPSGLSAHTAHPVFVVAHPNTALHDGEEVRVTVWGFNPGAKVSLSECGPGQAPKPGVGCADQLAAEPFTITDGSGVGTATITVRSQIVGRSCRPACLLLAVQNGRMSEARLRFAP